MAQNPLRNRRHDSGPRQIQSGPSHTTDPVRDTNSYVIVGSGYTDSLGNYVSWYGVNDVGADYGYVVAGPPNSGAYVTDEWRAVPAAPSGFWTDWEDGYYVGSGTLDTIDGFRSHTTVTIANAKVETSYEPQFGVREGRTFTYFRGIAPDNQNYDPYQTPSDNTSAAGGITGGGVTHARYEGTLLTNPTADTSGSRASWQYNGPVYCQTFTKAERPGVPGAMDSITRSIVRGKSTRYSYNLGGVYGMLGEGIRNMPHTFSSSVNSSNQKSI